MDLGTEGTEKTDGRCVMHLSISMNDCSSSHEDSEPVQRDAAVAHQ